MNPQHQRHLWWIAIIATLIALAAAALARADGQGARQPARSADPVLRAALDATPDPVRGEDLYAPCGACHGTDGRGVRDGSVPAIAAQHASVIIKQLTDYRGGRRWDVQMEHAAKMSHLQGPQELADVAAFIASLPRGTIGGYGPGEYLDVGARAYFRECESCHDPLGQGEARRAIPRLAGQHYAYLTRQFFDAVEERRPTMSTLHVRLMKPFGREEIQGISDYLSRTSPQLVRSRD